ncbi:MAG: enoyl-CoA hydratase-related protein [Candidatus Dormiibacterota bacterium]
MYVRQNGAVAELVLNRPATLNSINSEMAAELQRLLEGIRVDSACRCLVITGTGRGFCSGQELGEGATSGALPSDIATIVRAVYIPIVERIRTLPIPVVAAVNGVAAGAGLSLALTADLRVASSEAYFACGFSRIGLVPDSGASWFLPRAIGYARAYELTVIGRRLSAAEALEWGLVNRVFSVGEFRDDYMRLANEIAAGATRAHELAKFAFNESFTNSLSQQLELEARLQQQAAATADFAEGLAAFRGKRPPQFTGR